MTERFMGSRTFECDYIQGVTLTVKPVQWCNDQISGIIRVEIIGVEPPSAERRFSNGDLLRTGEIYTRDGELIQPALKLKEVYLEDRIPTTETIGSGFTGQLSPTLTMQLGPLL